MSATQHLKLRIERDGKVLHRYLRSQESLSVGRNPDNDVVLYGDDFPKKARLFVPSNGGYELRLIGNCRGEVLLNESRLNFNDLLAHNLLPHRDGYAIVPLTVGKFGYVYLDDVRIDFVFDGARVEAIEFAGFSATRTFFKSLKDDPLFRGIAAALLILHLGLVNWATNLDLPAPQVEIAAEKALQRIARFIPKVEEPAVEAKIGKAAQASASGEEDKKAKEEEEDKKSTKDSEGEKKGYGPKRDDAGQGVNVSELAALKVLGGLGVSDQSSNLMSSLIDNNLAKGLDLAMNSKNLTVGGNSSSGTSDLEAILAAGHIGFGQGGGGATIDEILKDDVGSQKSVNLEKKGRVQVDRIGQRSGSEEALGARSEESLRKVLLDKMGQLQYIYSKYLKTNPDLGGKVDVEVTINADGSVGKITVLRSDIQIPEFQNEIVAAIQRWRYDSIASGTMKVVYPIVFFKVG